MIKNDNKEIIEEIKRHQDVLYEKLQGDIRIIGEQHGSIQEKLDSHTEMIGSIKENIEIIKVDIDSMKVDIVSTKKDIKIIKVDIAFIKNGLKEKVDRDEFVALEKRVILLEAK